ncbi:MAG: Hsp33 family molecular chaperone HslO [Alphaproteobacteria bacterium]|nr:MAG: Hsp33 family molecular chaperone HslO [Alphaproteobacteria bacterium]
MSLARQIAWDDMILPFQLDRADIRGRVARLDTVLERILSQHRYPDPVADLVAEACLLTALIGQSISPGWRLSLQVRGEGPIRLIATDYFAPEVAGEAARMRAYAGFDAEGLPERSAQPFALLGRGHYGVTIDQGLGKRPYQGITPLAGGSLAASTEIYFAQSEQIATRFKLDAALTQDPGGAPAWRAGGVMLQHLPAAGIHVTGGPSRVDGLLAAQDVLEGEAAENWRRVNMLLDTAETHELIGPHVSPDALLVRLFHEEQPRVFQAQAAVFGCTCSAQKVVDAMAQYSARDIGQMTTEDGVLTADCQFCGAHFEFDPATLGYEARR